MRSLAAMPTIEGAGQDTHRNRRQTAHSTFMNLHHRRLSPGAVLLANLQQQPLPGGSYEF